MLGTTLFRSQDLSFDKDMNMVSVRASGDQWLRLSQTAILILGSPRSGTTWLAKIFDSHPDIL